jgi:type I restriction enzyme S subunit
MERLGYAKYESYKDSGLDWLGPIPEGWELLRSKFGTCQRL